MIDTLKLKSPPLTAEQILKIEMASTKKQAIDMTTGEQLYCQFVGQLSGSYDSRIGLKLDGDSVLVEGSVPKLRQGHNVTGYQEDVRSEGHFLVDYVSKALEIDLPNPDDWQVMRVDVAECYELGSFEQCQEYIRMCKGAKYPRRQLDEYGCETLYLPGRRFTLKMYHKGPDYFEHDFKRLKSEWGESKALELGHYANRIIRTEVTIRAMQLKTDCGVNETTMVKGVGGETHLTRLFGSVRCPLLKEIDSSYLHNFLDSQVRKLLKEGLSTMKVVRTRYDVERRLVEVYGNRVGQRLTDFWHRLSVHGVDGLKGSRSLRTVQRNMKMLTDAGVSWLGADVKPSEHNIVPVDFAPIRSDIRRIAV